MNVNDAPNHFRHNGDHTYGIQFGPIRSITAIRIPGQGHRPLVHVSFKGGSFDFTPEDSMELMRGLPAAVAALTALPDCSAIATDLEGTA